MTKAQIDYVLFHLQQHIDFPKEIISHFAYYTANISENIERKILFYTSTKELSTSVIINYKEENLPVLFPGIINKPFFEISSKNNLIFYHDILQSIFYLLSGYQEYTAKKTDFMGRYPYADSVQNKLQCVHKPLVNYYFEILADAIERYCQVNSYPVKRKKLFNNFGFMLTHDVDRIKYYHWRELVYKWLQVFGIKRPLYAKKKVLREAIRCIIPTFNPFLKKDPWYNFKEMRQQEKEHGLKSVWYFLNRDGSPHDAKYNFSDKKVKEAIEFLSNEGCEIGLHGSLKTADDISCMQKAYTELYKISPQPIIGTRQHFLKFNYNQTLHIQEQTGIKYDTTMGFAEHEGFRNSYCYPFKPYDHENDRMLNIWEIPLTIMDVTILGYRNLDFTQMKEVIQELIQEIKRFGGVMVLLWHNDYFDEIRYPGINSFYKWLLNQIKNEQAVSITGRELIEKIENKPI
jgi:hypothetical protein